MRLSAQVEGTLSEEKPHLRVCSSEHGSRPGCPQQVLHEMFSRELITSCTNTHTHTYTKTYIQTTYKHTDKHTNRQTH